MGPFISPWRGALVVLVGAVVWTGCYHWTGSMVEERGPHQVLHSAKDVSVPVPDSTRVNLAISYVGDHLVVDAVQERQCRTRHVETFRNYERTTEHLPGSHWVVLGVGAALAVGGGTTWALGEGRLPAAETGAIRSPAEEQDRDTGQIMIPIGVGVAALGALFLGSEAGDWLMTGHKDKRKKDSKKSQETGTVACEEGPAKGIELSISPPAVGDGAGGRVNFKANEQGQAVLPVFESELKYYGYGVPFATITCEHCDPISFELPIDMSARLVADGKRKIDLENWLDDHSNSRSPTVDRVRTALDAILAEEVAVLSINPEEERQSAQQHLWDGRFLKGRAAVHRCLLRSPRNRGCKKLLKEINTMATLQLVDRAMQFIRWQVPQRALISLEQCLEIDPRHRECKKLRRRAGRMWTSAKHGVQYRVRKITASDGTTGMMTEVKASKDYSRLFLAYVLYKGDEPVCMAARKVRDIGRNDIVAVEVTCHGEYESIDRVVMRVEDYAI